MVDRAHTLDALRGGPVGDDIARFRRAAAAVVRAADPSDPDYLQTDMDAAYDHLRQSWHGLKDALLGAAADGRAPIGRVNVAIDVLRSTLRATEQVVKAAHRLDGIRKAINPEADKSPDEAEAELAAAS